MFSIVTTIALGLAVVSTLFLVANLWLIPRLSVSKGPATAVESGTISICVPARNEERDVEAALGSLLALEDDDFEVVFVDDRSTDRTGEIAAALAATDPRLTVLTAPQPPTGWLGKPHALEHAARVARGEWLLFTDADVHLHPGTLAAVRGRTADHDVIVLMPNLETGTIGERIVLPFLGDAVLFYFPSFLANCTRPRHIALGAGAFILIRRAIYDRLGGHAALRHEVVDDMALAREAKLAGGRHLVAIGTELVRVRMYRGLREIFDGFAKNIFSAIGRSWIAVALLAVEITLHSLVAPAILIAALLGFAVPIGDLMRAGVAVGLMLGCRVATDLRLRRSLRYSLTLPLEQAALIAMAIRSAILHRRRGGVLWRGRLYCD